MDDIEFQSIIHGLATDAAEFIDGTLSQDRAKATEYYLGQPFGNEEEGRSQFVVRSVADSIHSVMPQFLRVIFGAENAVEFVPTRADTVEQAEQATDYVQYVFAQDNPGFAITHSVVKDALVRKLGIYKWGWDDTSAVRTYALKDIAQSQLEALVADDSVELLRATPRHPGTAAITAPAPTAAPAPAAPGQPPADPSQAPQGDVVLQPAIEPTFDVELKHSEVDGRAALWALPPEEFIFSPAARDTLTGTLMGHRTEKRTGELLAMGVSQEDIDEHGGNDASIVDSVENLARREVMGGSIQRDVDAGEANETHLYCELYPLVDFDGDGLLELRKVCTIGPAYHVISNEPCSRRPFAAFCPDPEPHTMLGQSWADRLMDLQRFESSIVRGTADSLALSLYPRMGYVEGQVNPTDLNNTEIGASIRMRNPGMLQPILHPFVGKESFPLLDYIAGVKEQRTGQSNGAMGLDADALQSTEKAAAGAAISASQGQTELLVRIFAETCMKPMFRGLLELLVENRPKKKVVKLRGKWVEVNPAAWDANMDVTVNVALGTTLVEKKIGAMLGIAAKQELIISTYGPSNPICTAAQYANTLRKLTQLNGIKDVDNYFSAVDPKWQPPAPQPQPDAAMAMVDVKKAELAATNAREQGKLQMSAMEKHAELEFQDRKLAQELAIAQEKIRAEMELGATELELKYKTTLAIESMKANVEGQKEAAKSSREEIANQLEHERTLALNEQAHAATMQDAKHKHEQALATIQATPAAPAPAAPAIEIHNNIPAPAKEKK